MEPVLLKLKKAAAEKNERLQIALYLSHLHFLSSSICDNEFLQGCLLSYYGTSLEEIRRSKDPLIVYGWLQLYFKVGSSAFKSPPDPSCGFLVNLGETTSSCKSLLISRIRLAMASRRPPGGSILALIFVTLCRALNIPCWLCMEMPDMSSLEIVMGPLGPENLKLNWEPKEFYKRPSYEWKKLFRKQKDWSSALLQYWTSPKGPPVFWAESFWSYKGRMVAIEFYSWLFGFSEEMAHRKNSEGIRCLEIQSEWQKIVPLLKINEDEPLPSSAPPDNTFSLLFYKAGEEDEDEDDDEEGVQSSGPLIDQTGGIVPKIPPLIEPRPFSDWEREELRLHCTKSRAHPFINSKNEVETSPAFAITNLWAVVSHSKNHFRDVTYRYTTQFQKLQLKHGARIYKLLQETIDSLNQSLLSTSLIGSEEELLESLDSKRLTVAFKADEKMPNTLAGFKKHPRFALESQLGKNEIIFDKNSITAYFNGEPVYLRSNVRSLKTQKQWEREDRRVMDNAIPMKGNDYYVWEQTTEQEFVHNNSSTVTMEERRTLDLTRNRLPPMGYKHLRNSVFNYIGLVAKNLQKKSWGAIIKRNFKGIGKPPQLVYDGIVVKEEDVDQILLEHENFMKNFERKKDRELKKQAIQWWKILCKIILARANS